VASKTGPIETTRVRAEQHLRVRCRFYGSFARLLPNSLRLLDQLSTKRVNYCEFSYMQRHFVGELPRSLAANYVREIWNHTRPIWKRC